jgi:prepilin-type N-terminal cleavage/methylation domain-containing protein
MKIGSAMGEKGFTLIEMMITAVIAVTLGVAGYSFSIDVARFQARHERQKEMETRLQIAMDIIARDIRHAGYGIVNPLTNPGGGGPCAKVFGSVVNVSRVGMAPGTLCNPITPGDGAGVDGTDTITILQVGNEMMGVLTNAVAEGAAAFAVTPSSPNVTTAGVAFVTLGGLSTVEVRDVAPGGGNLNLTLVGGLGPANVAFPAGFPVHSLIINPAFNSSDVYQIGNAAGAPGGLALLKNGQLFASGIEDLQVAYFLNDNGNALAPALLTVDAPAPGAGYLAIRVSLMAYAPHAEPNINNGRRPALENHLAVGAPNDNFVRAVLTRVVELKNDGCTAKDSAC